MVRPKVDPPKRDVIQENLDRINKENPIIATRYYIVEITPAYTEPGYYGIDVEEKRVRVSPFFESREEALDWFAEHEPDEGKRLAVVVQHKRRTIIEKWW